MFSCNLGAGDIFYVFHVFLVNSLLVIIQLIFEENLYWNYIHLFWGSV